LEAAKEYLTKLEEIGGKGIDRKKCQLELHLKPFFREKALAKITSFDLERYKKHRVDEGASYATVNRELAVLSHLFNMGVEWKWLTHRPAKINRYKEDNGRISYLTIEQCSSVLEAAKRDVSPHIYLYSLIALSTAMRMSEILSIRRENVDVARRRIYVPKAKAGAREQPMTAELASYLANHIDALPKGTEWLFPSLASKSGHLATIRKAHRRVVKAAGLDPDVVVRHTFRHTAVTHLVQAGVDLPTVQKISGHKTLSMVARYAHANGAHIDAAMERLQNRVGAEKVVPITPKLHKDTSAA
jgi:integrase